MLGILLTRKFLETSRPDTFGCNRFSIPLKDILDAGMDVSLLRPGELSSPRAQRGENDVKTFIVEYRRIGLVHIGDMEARCRIGNPYNAELLVVIFAQWAAQFSFAGFIVGFFGHGELPTQAF